MTFGEPCTVGLAFLLKPSSLAEGFACHRHSLHAEILMLATVDDQQKYAAQMQNDPHVILQGKLDCPHQYSNAYLLTPCATTSVVLVGYKEKAGLAILIEMNYRCQ